jgi:DnaJ-class molecular chaperone
MIIDPEKEYLIEQLRNENEQLKKIIKKERSKEKCYHCNGSGEIWTYWDGDTFCPHCSGSGRV